MLVHRTQGHCEAPRPALVKTTQRSAGRRALANAIAQGHTRYTHLDAPQLLKHALGFVRARGSRFQLWYIYFDLAGPVGDAHRTEIDRFAGAVGAELRFRASSYQQLIRSMDRLARRDDGAYVEYLRSRYLSELSGTADSIGVTAVVT